MSSNPYAEGRRTVVIHEDDIGMTHGSIAAFRELTALGVCSSGSVMVPCPWFPETRRWRRPIRRWTSACI